MSFDVDAIEVLLCDADGNLFPSEEPAFVASAEVANRLLAEIGAAGRYTPDALRREAVGRNFRSMAVELAARHGVRLGDDLLERYVAAEKSEVTAHLGRVLGPDQRVLEPIGELARRFRLAVVSSSASSRLDACFGATGLAQLFPPAVRFSAEDSLPAPASKPDPAVYRLAGERLGVSGPRGLAVEDAAAGVTSAVAAGFPVVGNLAFVPDPERATRAAALVDAGAAVVVGSWAELGELLGVDALARGAA
jgi:beta-phosphoglucomutase-like phosphatase (HAD superfamily)